jgi:hypothetical protein
MNFYTLRQWNYAVVISSFSVLLFLLFVSVLWWQCHYILTRRFCMCSSIFGWSLYLSRLLLSINPLSVTFSHDWLVVLLLITMYTTPHSWWCICSYHSLLTFLLIHFLTGLKQLQQRSCGAITLESELVSSFSSIDCYRQIFIPLDEVLWISYPITWFTDQFLCTLP